MINPRTKYAVKKRLVTYNPIERHWYRVADFVQGIWHRLTSRRAGNIAVKVMTVMVVVTLKLMWITLKITWYVMIAACVVGFGVMFVGLKFALGQGSLAKAISSANDN